LRRSRKYFGFLAKFRVKISHYKTKKNYMKNFRPILKGKYFFCDQSCPASLLAIMNCKP
jgi:hypothetical protein